MPDTRKKYQIGKKIPGFRPSQPPYIVGPDKKITGFTVHLTIHKMIKDGKWDRKVEKFHLSFKGIKPQPVIKWEFQRATDRFIFKGWAHKNKLGLDAPGMTALLVKANKMVQGAKKTFGSSIALAT